ncbi:MAG TPA: type II toxin-antitoxin system HicB family antitoxin [Caulobacteraceae bacterium]|nr:type II toxin-antitoxin system HicB family antitoxin [Caulobacteraceae bacterium]
MRFRIELEKDDNGTFLVTCPALPEVTTFGVDEADCIRHARDAIEEALAARLAAGARLPEPDGGKDAQAVPLAALTALKIELYDALQQAGINRAELTRRLGWNRNSVDRLFQIGHASRLDQIEAAAFALGRQVRVGIGEPEGREAV